MIDRIFINNYDANVENERFLQGYIASMKKDNKKDNTIEHYTRDIKDLLNFLKKDNLRVLDVAEDDLEDFFFYCQENGQGVDFIKRKFACVKTFFNYLKNGGWIEENPMQFLKKSKYRVFEIDNHRLNHTQVKKIFQEIKNNRGLQYKIYAHLSISTGVKFSCLQDLKWENVDFENMCIYNVEERPDKIIRIFFSELTQKLLLELKEDRIKNNIELDYIFLLKAGRWNGSRHISNKMLRSYCASMGRFIGIEDLTHISLRRTFAYLLFENGMSKEDISTILNFKDDKSSFIYNQIDIDKILEQKNEIFKSLNIN